MQKKVLLLMAGPLRGGGVKGPAINPLFTTDFPNYLKFNRRPVINVVHSKQTICVD